MLQPNLLKHIAECRAQMRKSEQKVADLVLAQPQGVIHMRIVDLAAKAKVSEPTVVRFCRALNFDGFQDFKLCLAQVLASNANFEQFSLNNQDTVQEFKHKIFESTVGNLMNVRDSLDSDTLEQAIDVLSQARRVEFWGFGASAAVAADAQHKFYRLMISSTALSDPHMQAISALTLGEQDVVVAISQTGRTKDLLHSIRLVHDAGAQVITLCPGQTPLSELADIAIHIDLAEDKDLNTLMTSRVAHLVVMDILAVGVAMRHGPTLIDHLKTIRRGLRSLRLNERRPLKKD
ncbi:transcriptional regulator HexR [Pokkaliibacter sp. CJK22405]|uniref:transcriptional regulator HexR n=1 Tax=Pokkaliibacter sp. CJK22405 TaxID=3384615 RepID=UPI0039846BCB